MMCQDRESVSVWVKVPADLAYEGRVKWKYAKIDRCIAPLIQALQDGGIDMRSSCCGHGDQRGHIVLQDGRELIICLSEESDDEK